MSKPNPIRDPLLASSGFSVGNKNGYQIAELEAPYHAALSRLQEAESLERVCCEQRAEKKETVDNLTKKAADLRVSLDDAWQTSDPSAGFSAAVHFHTYRNI